MCPNIWCDEESEKTYDLNKAQEEGEPRPSRRLPLETTRIGDGKAPVLTLPSQTAKVGVFLLAAVYKLSHAASLGMPQPVSPRLSHGAPRRPRVEELGAERPGKSCILRQILCERW